MRLWEQRGRRGHRGPPFRHTHRHGQGRAAEDGVSCRGYGASCGWDYAAGEKATRAAGSKTRASQQRDLTMMRKEQAGTQSADGGTRQQALQLAKAASQPVLTTRTETKEFETADLSRISGSGVPVPVTVDGNPAPVAASGSVQQGEVVHGSRQPTTSFAPIRQIAWIARRSVSRRSRLLVRSPQRAGAGSVRRPWSAWCARRVKPAQRSQTSRSWTDSCQHHGQTTTDRRRHEGVVGTSVAADDRPAGGHPDGRPEHHVAQEVHVVVQS